MLYKEITEKVIGVFYEVYRILGPGFLEAVYEEAMVIEFRRRGIKFGRQVGISVCYKDERCKDYFVDFLVEGEVVVEIKAKKSLEGFDEAQLINYLSPRDDSGEPNGTGKKVGLLVNFGGEDIEFKRMVYR
ncbi:MAG: GxxExxY protein [Nanoarchaeota archaeon]|nr:GxxExxY protein [Nanoarchaeota archaeon]